MKELIEKIRQKNQHEGVNINSPATEQEIAKSESVLGFNLPVDFKIFYSICDGFDCEDDIFNFLRISDITHDQSDYGADWFNIAEYMIYSDIWAVRIISTDSYEIFNGSYPQAILTTSLSEFLEHFASGHVFESNGLYQWQEELGIGETKNT